jgi:hypothetical protein
MDWFLMKGGKKQKEPQKEPLAKEPAPPPPAAPLGIQGAVLEEPSTGVTLAWQPADKTSEDIPLTDFPPATRASLTAFDTDGDGKVSVKELQAAVHHFQRYGTLKQREKRNRLFLIAAVVLFFAVTASQFGVMVGAVRLFKDTMLKGRVMTTADGDPVQVASTDFYVGPGGQLISRATGAAATVNGTRSARRMAAASAAAPVVATSAARVQGTLNSQLADAAWTELTTIGLVSPTGATMHLNVLGFIRHAPTAAGTLGSVELITHIGRVTITGTALTFDDDLPAALFHANGFTSVPAFAAGASGAARTRRRLLALELFGLFNAVLAASALEPLEVAGGAVQPPMLPDNFMMVMRRRMPCVPIKAGMAWSAPPDIYAAVPVYNTTPVNASWRLNFTETQQIVNYTTSSTPYSGLGALPAGPGVDLCAHLAIPAEYLLNTTDENGLVESFVTMGVTVYRRGSTNIRTEYQHPLAPNVTLVEIVDNSDPEFPLQYRFQSYGASKGVGDITPDVALQLFNFTTTGNIPALLGPISHFRHDNLTTDETEKVAGVTSFNVTSLLDSPFTYLGNVQLDGEAVRVWAFHLAKDDKKQYNMHAYWYDTVSDRTVRRIHYGAFGDLDVLTIQDFPSDPVSAHFLFAPPHPDIVDVLDDSFPVANKTSSAAAALPPRLTMDPFRPFVDTYVYSSDGAFTAARRAEALAQRREAALPHATPATGRRLSSITKTLSKLTCQAGNFCEARTSVGVSQGGLSTPNTFTLPLGFVDVTLGPVNKPPCMLEVGMGLPVSPIPFLSMSGAIAVELCKDYKGVNVAEGSLQIDLDPIAQIPGPVAMHKPLTMGGLNPLAFRLASATVGLYGYDNAGRNPQCTVEPSGAGFSVNPMPPACTGGYCKSASKNLLAKLSSKFSAAEARELCSCFAQKENFPSIAFGGGTDIPGLLLTGLSTFIPPAGPPLVLLSPFLALFKVTADFTFTWQPYSCGGLLRRDMNLDLALAISIPPVPMAFDFFNPEWSTLEHYSKGELGSHAQVPDVGASIVGAFKKLETMLKQVRLQVPNLRSRTGAFFLCAQFVHPADPSLATTDNNTPFCRTLSRGTQLSASGRTTQTRRRLFSRQTRAQLWATLAPRSFRRLKPCSSRRLHALTSSPSLTVRSRCPVARPPKRCRTHHKEPPPPPTHRRRHVQEVDAIGERVLPHWHNVRLLQLQEESVWQVHHLEPPRLPRKLRLYADKTRVHRVESGEGV